jgi:hypothetical protein
MNNPNPATPNDFAHLESDLLPLLADLDKLARIERGGDAALEDRIMQASLGALHGVQPVSAQAAELGAIDRASAPQDLEQNVYEASAPALQQAAGPRLVVHSAGSESNERRHIRVARRAWWTSAPVRMAALVALVAGVAIGIRNANTSPIKESPSDKVNRDLDALFAAVDHATGETKDTDTATTDYDPDKLSEWLLEGSAS